MVPDFRFSCQSGMPVVMHEQCLLRIGMALEGREQQVLLRMTKDYCSKRFRSHAGWLAEVKWIEIHLEEGCPRGCTRCRPCAHVINNKKVAVSYHADHVFLTGILSLIIFMQGGWQRSLG